MNHTNWFPKSITTINFLNWLLYRLIFEIYFRNRPPWLILEIDHSNQFFEIDRNNRFFEINGINWFFETDGINRFFKSISVIDHWWLVPTVDHSNQFFQIDPTKRLFEIDSINQLLEIDRNNRFFKIDGINRFLKSISAMDHRWCLQSIILINWWSRLSKSNIPIDVQSLSC